MKRRGAGECSLIRSISGGLYKSFGFWFGEPKARLLGVRNESYGIVVYEKGVVKEMVI